MKKNFAAIGWCASLLVTALTMPAVTSATTYTTPLLDATTYHFRQISWTIVGEQRDFTFSWQEITDGQDNDWQPLTEYTCRDTDDERKCRMNLPVSPAPKIRLRVDFANDSTLKTLNLNFQSPEVTSDIPDADEKIFYSNFKNLDNLIADQISWHEQTLTTPARDRLIIQTRATTDGETWSDWQGNAQVVLELTNGLTLNPEEGITSDDTNQQASEEATPSLDQETAKVDFISRPGHLSLQRLPEESYDRILVTYRDDHHHYRLATPAAAGDDETSAYSNRAFHLDTLDGLHLGDTIILTDTVDGTTYKIEGIISDLKTTDNLVAVFAWRGAIPKRLTGQCAGANFCFSTTSEIHRLAQTLLPSSDDSDHALYQEDGYTLLGYAPEITNISFLQPTDANCLEYVQETRFNATQEAQIATCKTHSLPLAGYYDQSQVPQSLQYRILYDFAGDKTVTDVFLHQAETVTSNNDTGPVTNRLRGGKKIDAGSTKAVYWR